MNDKRTITANKTGRASLARRAHALAAALLATTVGLAGCLNTSPESHGDGAELQIAVAPLTLLGITDAEYNLRVYNSDTVFDASTLVWSLDGVTSTQYGDSKGAISYIGPCDAGVALDNTVELITVSFTGDGTFQLPCPASAPCRISTPCEENADALVEFKLTVMRNALQGFFDIAVNFEDIFCSAKVDCLNEGLLHDVTGEREDTVVVGLACTGGPGTDGTALLFDDITMTCDDTALSATISTEPALGDGNQMAPALDAAGAGVSVYQVGIYQGMEQLECGVDDDGDPISCQKVYSNTSIGIGAAAFGASCTLTGAATAGSGDFASPTPGLTAYPIITLDVQITDGATSGLICGTNPLNGGTPPDGSTPGTGCYADPRTGVCTGYTDLSDPDGVPFSHRYPPATAPADPICGDGFVGGAEECDGGSFVVGSDQCSVLGALSFVGGQLLCTAGCTIDLSQCQLAETALDASRYHVCWVEGAELECLDSDLVTSLTAPPSPAGSGGVRDVASGQSAVSSGLFATSSYSCALFADGTTSCFTAVGDDIPPGAPPNPAARFVRLATENGTVCGVQPDLSLYCWGPDADVVGDAPTSGAWLDVAVGIGYGCALATDGSVSCWGPGPRTKNDPMASPTRPPMTWFTRLSANTDSYCARSSDGGVTCVDDQDVVYPDYNIVSGRDDYTLPVPATLTDAELVDVGQRFGSCAVRADGTGLCWGMTADGATPVVPTDLEMVAITRGGTFVCFKLLDGTVACID